MKSTQVLSALLLAGLIAGLPAPATAAAETKAKATPAPKATTDANTCPRAELTEHMQRMQAMHVAMANARTPEERAKLMEAHGKLMQQGLDMMQRMPGGHMGGWMGGGMGMRGGSGGAQGACMAERMAMMQMMMQMMTDRMLTQPPAK